MIVVRDLNGFTPPANGVVATIGNFDGVHLGHREIFRRVREEALQSGAASVVITFDPHPLRVIPSSRSIKLISTLQEKITLIGASGVDYLVIIPFDAAVAAILPREFVEQVLVGTLGVRRLVVGHDYAFGRNRAGDVGLLRSLGAEFDFVVEELAPIASNGVIYSSSLIRSMVRSGAVAEVVRYLGRHYSLSGTVMHGSGRGESLGFPTANIRTDKELLPAQGVYAVKVRLGTDLLDGACNVGDNPTFGPGPTGIEVHLIDTDRDLYGQELRLYFIDRIRNEQRFASVEDLVAAITQDVQRCRELLATAAPVLYTQYLDGV
jgi:riboflavin kinase/FMN adenylyltransferase